jgi:TonB family protein
VQAVSAFALVSLFAASAAAQPPATQIVPKPPSLPAAVTGSPFSAERRQVRTRTLEDGTRITETWPVHKIFRDAEGRTRTERPLLPWANAPELPRVVELDDPAAGTEIVLDPQRKQAHRFTQIPAAPVPPDSAAASESLGAWVIQGFRAEGQRRVVNSVVTETWTAPELQLILRQSLIDPEEGDSVTELTRIRVADQEPALFHVPPDFSIVDESADFAIPYVVRSRASLPLVISKVPALYTDDARRGGIQGTVHLTLFVDESGRAQGIRVERSLEPGLDQEAIKAVRRWRFRPGEQDGRAVRVPVRVEVTFSLNN